MTTIYEQTFSEILDNYADVIEGGNSYNGGTAFKGIPGTQSVDRSIDEIGTFEQIATGTTTTVKWTNTLADTGRLIRSDATPLFLLCLPSAAFAGNVGAARKITGWTATTITVQAFPGATQLGDDFRVLEGFKRLPDNYDIETVGPDIGFDRMFQLKLIPGNQLDLNGNGTRWFSGTLELRLRFEKKHRQRRAYDSLIENMTIIRSILPLGDHRDATYVQSIDARNTEPEVEEDDDKVVITDAYDITYRVQSAFL